MKSDRDIDLWETLIMDSPDIICTLDSEGCYVNINEACEKVLGYERREMIGRRFTEFIHPEDLTFSLEKAKNVFNGDRLKDLKNRGLHKKGKEVFVLWSGVWSEKESLMFCIGRDITEQERAKQKDELYKAMFEYGSDIVTLFDENLNFLYCGTSTYNELGYQPDNLTGTSAFSYIHPGDIPFVKKHISESVGSGEPVTIPEYRLRHADGEWRWLETRLSNQLKNPAVKAIVANSRDVTRMIESRLKIQESEQNFKALFENNLDLVLFQNTEGIIENVNSATLEFFKVPKEDLINKPVTYFLSPELAPVCEKALKSALDGQQVSLELNMPIEGAGLLTFEAAKIPVVAGGATVGVYTILKDVTEIRKSHSIIKRQAEKLKTIFESITDAFFTLDRYWNFTYINTEFEKLIRIKKESLIGRNIRTVFPEQEEGAFYRHFHTSLETGKAVHFEGYLARLNAWLQVKAFPSEEGLFVNFDEITDEVNAKKELELLSLVASKTTNGIVIHDAEGRAEWVNDAFTEQSGYSFSEVAGKKPCSYLKGEDTDPDSGNMIKEGLKGNKPFSEEILIYRKSGEKMWVALDFAPVTDDDGKVTRFISIQTDITFRKETEASQLHLTEELYRRYNDLQQFAYIVSHNLRSPVAGARGIVDLLFSIDKNSQDFDQCLQHLKTSIYKMEDVLNDLGTILSARDKHDSTKEPVELISVCRQVLEEQHESLVESGGEVFLDFEEDISLMGNKAYLYSIFHNLLSNAIKYRSPKRLLKVEIRGFRDKNNSIAISFSDNGLGFNAKLIGEDLFKLYKRFHHDSEGKGIGMFLVKSHVEAMNGRIEVKSEVDAGAKFLINFK